MTDVPTTPRRPMSPTRRLPQMARPGAPSKFYNEVVVSYSGDECLLWPFDNTRGYGRIQIGRKRYAVHRLLCELAHGPAPSPQHHAAHSCGNGGRGCVTRNHLSWKTAAENEADKMRHGTDNRGQRNGRARLTPEQVREILALRGKMLQREIGAIYGIAQTQVSVIHRRKQWKSIDA